MRFSPERQPLVPQTEPHIPSRKSITRWRRQWSAAVTAAARAKADTAKLFAAATSSRYQLLGHPLCGFL